MTKDEIAFLNIRELGALLRAGDLSPTKLTELCLRRLDDIGRRLNAVVTVTEDVAYREAALAETELRAGLDRGPLHGIPYGLKDIISATGAPTTWGAFPDQRFEQEATVTRKLRDAGAVLLAKVATIELAGGMGYGNPDASITGAPGNPWHTGRWTNGSSSGPGAVVGAGVLPFAIGSDTGGSILLPAAFTGTAGLRATYGRVSRAGAMTLCWTLDRLGPLCRCADDCGLVLEAIAGPDPRDPSTLGEGYQYRRARPRRDGFRFGVVAGADEGVEPEVRANFAGSLALLGEIGTIEEVELPELPYDDVAEIVIGAEAYAAFDEFIAAGGTGGLTAAKAHTHRLAGAVLPAHDYLRAQRIRRVIATEFGELAGRYDALVAPTLGVVATGRGEDFEYMLPGAFPRPLNFAGVLSGTPTISVLNGLGRDGLPTGIQFAGAPLRENAVIDAASALEARAGTTALRPDGPHGVAAAGRGHPA
ncbi:MAG: Amidase [Amycolatopsis sp.]|jgi:aspartyl-tRNA(Asn)/glutamyl-tRNA(Gln) amidotransferase subunit A|uniref:amidase n=1 Tax=Amycolatopsis sp. TaxID=37632 RepID=UPI00261296AC|nr:amidase [Amycolatopsis sp.]MCU1680410.1 Amidase [Amycolatopsis sp.]